SRRRHTRCLSDWSSDVCSSDLAWIAGELFVAFAVGTVYAVGAIALGWPAREPAGFVFATYILALMSAIFSVTMVARILRSKSAPESFPVPPSPPEFLDAGGK